MAVEVIFFGVGLLFFGGIAMVATWATFDCRYCQERREMQISDTRAQPEYDFAD